MATDAANTVVLEEHKRIFLEGMEKKLEGKGEERSQFLTEARYDACRHARPVGCWWPRSGAVRVQRHM